MKKIVFLAFYFALLVPQLVFAQLPGSSPGQGGQPTGSSGGVKLNNPLTVTSITDLFKTLLEILLVFAVPIVVFFIILAGFKFVMAQGNTETLKEARRALLYAVIGGVLILGASVLIEVIQGTVDAVKN